MRNGEPTVTGNARAMHRRRGLSLPEIVIAVSILGVLLAVAIPQMQGTLSGSKNAVARHVLETLNQAVHRYGQANGEIVETGIALSANEEMRILRDLQWRNPDSPKPGSPYMRPDWNPNPSSDPQDYRLQWSGLLYSLLPPGSSGAGIKVVFDGSDITTPWIFPDGYKPGGR
jgi:prepilin-type N-terminal cleavage/methylation domain-containing protein